MDALNKSLALVLWAKDENGEDDVAVFSGTLILSEGNYYLQREGDGPKPEIRTEWLERIKATPDDVKETLLGCDYQLTLTIGSAEGTPDSLESFGLKWPE